MSDLTSFLLDRIAQDESRLPEWFVGTASEWQPIERIRIECEAKRRIVEEHSEGVAGECGTCVGELGDYYVGEPATGKPWPCPTLRFLALPYADHPEYRQEWRA